MSDTDELGVRRPQRDIGRRGESCHLAEEVGQVLACCP